MLTYLIACLFLCFVMALFSVDWLIKRELENFVIKNCKNCSIVVDRIHFSLISSSVKLEGVVFIWGYSRDVELKAEIEHMLAKISIPRLIAGELYIINLEIELPEVVLTEGDFKKYSLKNFSSDKENNNEKFKFLIDSIHLINGTFTYIRNYNEKNSPPRSAILKIKKINGFVSQVGNTPLFIERIVHAEAGGQLEHSGYFKLLIDAPIFAAKLNVLVGLQISNQDLSDLNSFFIPSDGVKLKGLLLSGESSIQVHGNKLKGWVKVKYKDFNINLEKTKKRNRLTAFISDIISYIQFNSSNLKDKTIDQICDVELERESDESIVNFILRGMETGALRVAKNK